MVEVKSPTDSIEDLEQKINNFLQQGTRVGILINPETHLVTVFRPDTEAIQFTDGEILTVPDLLPGWQVQISDLWSPVFDEFEEQE